MSPKLRKGIRTSEFWTHLLFSGGILLAALSGHLSPQWAAVAIAASQTSYALGRAITKLGDPVLNGDAATHITAVTGTTAPPGT